MRRLAPVSLLVVAAAVAVLVGDGAPTRTFTASLADARGLVEGAEVRVAGVRVGEVERIALADDGFPEVRLSVEEDVRPRAGARLTLRLASLSGERNRYLALDPGAGPALGAGERLERDATRTPVEIDAVLSALTPRTRAEVRGVVRALRAGTAGRGGELAATLAAAPQTLGVAAEALRDVQADGEALQTLVRDARDVSATLAAGRATVGASVREAARLLRATAVRDAELEATIAGLPDALEAADGTLARAGRTLPRLDALVRAAAPGVDQLPVAARELSGTVDAARPVLASARALAADAPAQLTALRPLLREAAPVLERAAPVLRRLGPMLDEARVRLPDFFSFFSNWADFTANYDANGHAARVGIVLPPAGTRTLAPDATGAGQLAEPYLRTPGALEGEPWRDYEESFVAP